MIHTTKDFYNKLSTHIGQVYFPNVKYHRDDENYQKSTYVIELFNNGCITYRTLIGRISKYCKDSTKNIHTIVERYVISFGNYQYKPKK